MLGSQRSPCHDKTNSDFVDSSEGVRRKGRMSSTTDRYRAGILDEHRDRHIRWLQLSKAQSQRVMDQHRNNLSQKQGRPGSEHW